MEKTIFSTREAANYTGLSLRGFQHHVYTLKDVAGTRIGKTLVFTKDELDRFLLIPRRRPGRPRKESNG